MQENYVSYNNYHFTIQKNYYYYARVKKIKGCCLIFKNISVLKVLFSKTARGKTLKLCFVPGLLIYQR